MPISTINPHELLSLQRAAADGYAGYSTLRKLIADGRLPAVNIGRRVKVRRSDLESLAVPAPGRPTDRARIDAAIDSIVAAAPQLTGDQARRLAALLGGER